MFIPPEPEDIPKVDVAPKQNPPEDDIQATKYEDSHDVSLQQRQGHLHVVARPKYASGPSSGQANKTILLYNQHGWPDAKLGTATFAMCPVKTCSITKSKHDMKSADAVLFKDFVPAIPRMSPDQLWVSVPLKQIVM